MTSRKKITAIAKAAKKYKCAVYLKTGAHPPGIMIGESRTEERILDWTKAIKVSEEGIFGCGSIGGFYNGDSMCPVAI